MMRIETGWSRLLVAATLAGGGCGGSGTSTPSPTPVPTPPPVFAVELVSSTPAAGGVLDVASPNDTPVALSVTFSVTVPPADAGTYYWTTALQARQPPGSGFEVPVVTTGPYGQITLGAGTQTVTVTAFHTTNAICYSPLDDPGVSTSLDVDVRTFVSFTEPPFYGRRFPVTFTLRCP